MDRITLAQSGRNEIVIKKSRFITSMGRVATAEEAEAFVADVRRANRKANHNVWAARIGWPVSVERASDDGEPSGTAGAPTCVDSPCTMLVTSWPSPRATLAGSSWAPRD